MEAIFGQPYYRLTLEEAIARGDLAKPDYRVLTDHVKRLEELGSEIKGLKVNEINSKIFVKKRDAEIGEEIYDHIEDLEDPRMIVFCPSIAYAERMADFVPGIAAPYHSKLPKSEQEKRMRQFKAGKLTTLLAVDKLNEGVDVPEASVLVFLRSTESRTIFLQQLGRGLRKYQGKESVLVLDFVASWERIRDIRLLQERVHGIYSSKPKPIETEAPFKFEFSEEALNAIEVIEFARGATKRPERLTPQKPLVEKWKRDEDELKALLGVESLPNQKLSKHDWQKYTSRILKGDTDAINELLMHRLRTLWGMANKAFKNADNLETTVEDVFQHAYIGAHEGLSKYRAGLGSSLEMMFLISAKRQIDIALSGNSLIKLPFTVAADQAQIKETEQQIAEENSVSHVNPVELSSVLGMDFDKAVALQYYSHAMAYEKLLPISAAESVPDPSPQEELIDEIDFRWMAEFLLDGVLDREKTVLEHRYGLNGKQLMTLDETGRLLESQNFPDTVITRERVRQIENATLKKLANIAVLNDLSVHADIRSRTPIVTSMDPNERAVALRLGYKLAPNYSEWGDRTEYKMQIRSLRDELKRSSVKKRRNR
jgi:RNA polymerase sigma factor (sigma-70 family)